jgi:hypothetical protein
MATALYFRNALQEVTSGVSANLDGLNISWVAFVISTTAGSGQVASSTATVAGATNGVEVQPSTNYAEWLTSPLAADVTISGSITWNLWASESSMSANVAINGILEVIDGATGTITLIDKTARTTELGTSLAAVNFSETPASGVACKKGDRLRARVFGDDAGTMASGFTFAFNYNGGLAADTGGSLLTLTEDLTFLTSEPAGTQIYPTNTASDVSTASVDREAWTSRGAGVQDDVTNAAAGPSKIQTTDTAGGTVVDWFTKPLAAMTLSGLVRCNIRALQSGTTVNSTVACEIAVVDNDGTNPVAWAYANKGDENSTTQVAKSFVAAGDDQSISAGQRLRIRLFITDCAQGSSGLMNGGGSATTYYAGTTGGASGDTFLTFTDTLTEDVPQVRIPVSRQYPQLLAH